MISALFLQDYFLYRRELVPALENIFLFPTLQFNFLHKTECNTNLKDILCK